MIQTNYQGSWPCSLGQYFIMLLLYIKQGHNIKKHKVMLNIQNIKALGLVVSDKNIFSMFS